MFIKQAQLRKTNARAARDIYLAEALCAAAGQLIGSKVVAVDSGGQHQQQHCHQNQHHTKSHHLESGHIFRIALN